MKVGVVGAGLVGSTSAYSLVLQGSCSEIVLVDKNSARADAEADDIMHAAPFAQRVRVKSGDYSDLAGSRIVIVGAGVGQRPGESRLQLLQRNADVFSQVIPGILDHAHNAVLLIVTNPVDVMTHIAAGFAAEYGVPSCRVIGSGTTLDTARFRSLLGRHFGIDPQHVHGYVVGEHGDSEVLTWSLVSIGVTHLSEFSKITGIELSDEQRTIIDSSVRRAAYHIIEGKGATYYGIAGAVAHIVEVILNDYRALLTISARTPRIEGVEDVTLSIPRLLGGNGIIGTFLPPLSQQESSNLRKSAEVVRQAITDLGDKFPNDAAVKSYITESCHSYNKAWSDVD